jgi:uncharacterized protein YdeI (YjbR/CyaY-like superfamily)
MVPCGSRRPPCSPGRHRNAFTGMAMARGAFEECRDFLTMIGAPTYNEAIPPGVLMKPVFFDSPEKFRTWLDHHHRSERELLVGFHKKASGKPSLTWPESVDEALSFGWIDGVRKSYNATSYTIRFTPRRPGSVWSAVNIRRARALIRQGRMRPDGKKAFAARRENRAGVYSYEQRPIDLEPPYSTQLRKHPGAWTFFHAQPPSYRKAVTWWILSAKKEETRRKRMRELIACSENNLLIPPLRRRPPG